MVDKHCFYAVIMASSSSRDRQQSTLFSSEKEGMQSVPFSHVYEKPIYDRTAGSSETRDELEINSENLMENFDDLTDEQLDELLRDALDINQRLKAFERKQNMDSRGESMADGTALEESESRTRLLPKRSHFLPPLHQTQTSLVTRVDVVPGAKTETAGRRKKTSVM